MKRLDLILNGKGGVGKSFFAVNFVQYLKDKGIKHVAIDSDNENSTLNRFHPDASFIDLADRRGLDGVFNLLEKSNLVVMDCRAASTDLFTSFFETICASFLTPPRPACAQRWRGKKYCFRLRAARKTA